MSHSVRIRVPATSANLGPGFDALGLALGVYDEVVATREGSGVLVTISGAGAGELPTDERHLVAATALATFRDLGDDAAGLRLHCTNRIPQARGLGSSAAAIVAGVLLARALSPKGEQLDDAAVLSLAAAREGHADNVAACLYGGVTVAWQQEGVFRAAKMEPISGLRACVFVPQDRSETAESRRLLPESVPHGDAAHAAGRAALLVAALTADPTLLLPATEDRLHQPYRATAMPESVALVDRLRADGYAAVISGAGPTVLVLSDTDDNGVNAAPPGWTVHNLALDRSGALCETAAG